MNKKIIFIGQIESNGILSGPGQVLYNIYNHIDEENEVELINTYREGIAGKISIFLKIFKLLFVKNCVINVHTFGYLIPYLVYLISVLNKNNDYYMTLHGIISLEKRIKIGSNPTLKEEFLEKQIISKFPNIIVVSNYLKNYISENYNRNSNVYVIRNGVNYNDNLINTNKNQSTISFVMAGGISTLKGIIETCQLISSLKSNGIDCTLDIYGPIESDATFQEYKDFIKKNQLEDIISYHGKIPYEQLIKIFTDVHYVICLSKFDTFNLTILEALSVGTPVIITKEAGVSEIVTSDCGLIVDSNDYFEEIYHFITVDRKVYDNRQLLAKQVGKKHDWKIIANEYFSLFKGDANV